MPQATQILKSCDRVMQKGCQSIQSFRLNCAQMSAKHQQQQRRIFHARFALQFCSLLCYILYKTNCCCQCFSHQAVYIVCILLRRPRCTSEINVQPAAPPIHRLSLLLEHILQLIRNRAPVHAFIIPECSPECSRRNKKSAVRRKPNSSVTPRGWTFDPFSLQAHWLLL